MSLTRLLRSGPRALLGVMLIQFVLAAFFVLDFLVDVGGLRTEPPSYTFRELVQIAAWVALILSIIINFFLLRAILQRGARLEQGVRLAAGAFQELLDEAFQEWCLTASERDVALLAIKGLSNAEIAQVLGKSEGTVKAQSNAVFRKAGVSGRVQLMNHFMDQLLDGPLLRRVPMARPADEARPVRRQRPLNLPASDRTRGIDSG